jgi:hypothetical protein
MSSYNYQNALGTKALSVFFKKRNVFEDKAPCSSVSQPTFQKKEAFRLGLKHETK